MASILPPYSEGTQGTHALVIGVSRYPFADGSDSTPVGESFNIENLSSAARSASEFAAWLIDEYRNPEKPLISLRILLSPANGETIHPTVRAMFQGDIDATRAAVELELSGFRRSCDENSENLGMVYVAGHGVQLSKREATVLLSDFGDSRHPTVLTGAIDMLGCHDAMDESGGAENQIWFVDSCRQKPTVADKFERLSGALSLDEGNGSVHASPLILASATREAAFSNPGGTSLFLQALLWAFRGAAAVASDDDDQWQVTAIRLIKKLPPRVLSLAGKYGEEQNVVSTGRVNDIPIHHFTGPPDVDLEISLEPEAATSQATGSLKFGADLTKPPISTWRDWPQNQRIPAGLYQLDVHPQPPFGALSKLVEVKPPECTEPVEVPHV